MNSDAKNYTRLVELIQTDSRIYEIACALDMTGNSKDVRINVISMAKDLEFIEVLTLGLPVDCVFRIKAAWQQWCQLSVLPRVKIKILRKLVRLVQQIEDGLMGLETFCDDLPEGEK